MTTVFIANTTDALGGFGWTFDASNFIVGPVGTGVNVGAPANPDQANSVNVATNLYINNVLADATFAPLASPTFTGTTTFATLTATTANVTTCQSAHYELNGVDIKAARAFVQATNLVPGGFTPKDEFTNQFVGLNKTITPAVSGLVYILVSGNMSFSPFESSIGGCQVFNGTGTPPTQGQQLFSTPNYTKLTGISCPVVTDENATQIGFFGGLTFFQGTVGTTYWVDIQVSPFSNEQPEVYNVNIALVEV